jgi:hypothetical protein
MLVASVLSCASIPGEAAGMTVPAGSVVLQVGTESIGLVDRALFSHVNYQYLFGQGSPAAVDRFRALGPAGSVMRVEVRIDLAEPENDNEDPLVVDPLRLVPERAVVYAEDAEAFFASTDALGMDIMLVLTYNVPWLGRNGRLNDPPSDTAEWVEFALESIRRLDAGSGRIKYVEIWNEPNIQPFWTGTRQEYFELFNAAADAIHREFPHVMVGGPVLSPSGGIASWLRDFTAICGDRADFLSFHSYGQSVEALFGDIDYWGAWFRDKTGKQGKRILISETDSILGPKDKFRYLMRRSLASLDHESEILGFFHFALPRYLENQALFGLIDLDGSILGHNYLPYLAFRDIRGQRLITRSDRKDVAIAAARDGEAIGLVAFNGGGAERRVALGVDLVPSTTERQAVFYQVDHAGVTLVGSWPVAAGTERFEAAILLPANTALTGRIAAIPEGEELWLDAKVDTRELLVGSAFKLELSAVNLGTAPATGRLIPAGLPGDWPVHYEGSNSFENLAPGERFVVTARVDAVSASPGTGSPVYTFSNYRLPGTRLRRATSLPANVLAFAPVAMEVIPGRVFVAPGGSTTIRLGLTNTHDREVSGTARLDGKFEEGAPGVQPFQLRQPGASMVMELGLKVPAGTEAGLYEYTAMVVAGEAEFGKQFELVVADFRARTGQPVDLSRYFDSDCFTDRDKFGDVGNFGGPFSYPARFFPAAGPVQLYGMPFIFPDSRTGAKNGLKAEGQSLSVSGQGSTLAVLAAATNGNKRTRLVVHYSDGSRQTLPLEVTDWCVDSKFGEVEILGAPYRHSQGGILEDASPRIFLVSLDLDSTKGLVALELPPSQDLWFFALSVLD